MISLTHLLAWTPLLNPIPVWSDRVWPWLLLPLAAAVSVVYKSIKCREMKQVPKEAAVILSMIVLSMIAAAVVLAVFVETMEKVVIRALLLPALLCCLTGCTSTPNPSRQSPIHLTADRRHFAAGSLNTPFVAWGFNYDHDEKGRLIEDYWIGEWDKVRRDFAYMKSLGGNVVRVHLQVAKFMDGPDHPNQKSLQQLIRLTELADETGLYLDLTGLACYRKSDVPQWYSSLDETRRWDVQCSFWRAIAGVCKDSPAIFCYDLMNEPIVGGGDQPNDWLPGPPLGGFNYVQRLSIDPHGRTTPEIYKAWVAKLSAAVRSVDRSHLITVGVIPWVQVFKGGQDPFYSTDVCAPLDFVSIHFYPKAVPVEESLKYVRAYEIGKPVVIEEIFPLDAGIEKTSDFIKTSRSEVDGYISFYWGETVEQNEKKNDFSGKIQADWLRTMRDLAPAH